jgi:hypothetical protein
MILEIGGEFPAISFPRVRSRLSLDELSGKVVGRIYG